MDILLLCAATLVTALLIPLLFEYVRKALILARLPHAKGHWLQGVDAVDPQKVHKLDVDWAKSYGPIVACRIRLSHMVVVYDPILAHKLTSKDSAATKSHECVGQNLVALAADDKTWAAVRTALTPAFAPKNMRQAFDVVRDTALQLCDVLRSMGDETYVDIDNYAMRETIDVIGKWGFGVDLGAVQGNNTLIPGMDVLSDIQMITYEMNKQMRSPLRRNLYKWLPGGAKTQQCCERFLEMKHLLLEKARELQDAGQLDKESIAAHLLSLKDANGKPWTDDALVPQVGIMLFAGHDTCGHTIAYALYLISQYPDTEQRLTQELAEHGLLQTMKNPNPRALQYTDLQDLPYLLCVVREAMRLLPVVPSIAREFKDDVKLDGYLIPRNTPIVVSHSAIHMCCWPRSDFRPERWMEEHADTYVPELHNIQENLPEGAYTARTPPVGVALKTTHSKAASADEGQVGSDGSDWLPSDDSAEVSGSSASGPKRFLPFSQGPRDCIGQSLAKVLVPATIAVLLSRFSFELDPDYDIDKLDCVAGVMRPDGGMPLRCISRME